MTTTIPSNPTAQNVAYVLPKLYDADADFRYMALNDLQQMLINGHPSFLTHDYTVCAKIVEGLLHTLNDTNGEVQNMALKCIGPFVNKAPENILCPMIDKISTVQTENAVDTSIPALALREVVINLPRPIAGMPRSKNITDAYSAISKALIPRLVGYIVIPTGRNDLPPPPKGMLAVDMEQGSDSNAIDLLTEVARCFGPLLAEAEVQALQKTTLEVLENDRVGSVLKKKAVIAISTLAAYFSDSLLSAFISRLIESLGNVHLTRAKRKLYITILGSMARSIPRKFGPYLKTLGQFVMNALSEQELENDLAAMEEDEERDPEVDEVREAALVAVDSFLSACGPDMRIFTNETIDAATRFIKYDPNLAHDEDDEPMEEEDDTDALSDEDFEEEDGFDDEDDSSWKIRRCAAKVLYTLISTRSGDLLEDGTLYDAVAPALVARFKEREENVRLEVLAALSALVRSTGKGSSMPRMPLPSEQPQGVMGPPPSRKRRRGGSDASMFDSHTNASLTLGFTSPITESPPTTAQTTLSKLSPEIVRGVTQLLKSSPLPTKQASVVLLKDIVFAQRGGLSEYLDQIFNPVIEVLKTSSSHAGVSAGASSSATVNSVRIQALQLLGGVAETHPLKVLQPYLSKVIPILITVSRDKYSKVSVEALATIEHFILALTSRSAPPDQQNQQYLDEIYEALASRISANDADLEVRQRAIHVLGLLLGRTSGSDTALSKSKRAAGLDLLLERLKNELTRLASVRAINTVVALTQADNELSSTWVCSVALELGAQLRKASRSLRGASLAALRAIAVNPVSRKELDSKTVGEVVRLLLPLLTANDLHLLGPALTILATFVKENANTVVNEDLSKALCVVVKLNVTGSSLDALLSLVRTIGDRGVGRSLMGNLLQDVGVAGKPDIVGKVVGNLLVHGGPSVGVKADDFVKELKTAGDDKRKCLALAVLGEAALLLGPESPLKPDLFMGYFTAKSDSVPLAAAVALGRAGAGNIKVYLPVILDTMSQPQAPRYLLLHSMKEILQHEGAEAEIIPYAQPLWQNLVTASQAEDNKAIGAECVGKLAIIDPKTYLPQLQTFLSDKKASVRGMVISALRSTLADTDETYDEYLKPIVIPMMAKMLNESELENRRLALTTFASAMHNKPELIFPQLNELLPLVMKETFVKPELIREVAMGPFKHKVDDGLELRKSAYETLYALLESAFSRLPLADFYDRIIAGIGDEQDIRILCNLILIKLTMLVPSETRSRLEAVAERFRGVLSTKPKDNAVKQEIERIHDGYKGVLKSSIQLNKILAADAAGPDDSHMRHWQEYWDWARKEYSPLVKTVEDELKDKDR